MERFIVQVSYAPNLNMSQQINLPEEYLDHLIQGNHNFPFYFKIEDETKQEKFYSSVLEFSTEESIIEIPYVIANQFPHMQSGSVVELSFLSKVLFCKDLQIEPITENFFFNSKFRSIPRRTIIQIIHLVSKSNFLHY